MTDIKDQSLKVKFSPVGPGRITGESERGYPKVNDVAVGWFWTEQNTVVDYSAWFDSGKWRLFIDDERNPIEQNWIIARSSEEAIEYVKLVGTFPKEIAFDHDLGGDDTSMKFINWMTEMLIEDNKYKFHSDFNYTIHSQNPVGKMNIEGLMENLIKQFKKV